MEQKIYESPEEWRDIKGYEGFYKVSNKGRVLKSNGHYMKPSRIWDNHFRVALSKNGERKAYLVHRLVALAFIPNPRNYPQINHKNENGLDNRAENLEWCSPRYNLSYGTRTKRSSEHTRIPISQYGEDGKLIKVFPSIKDAANETKCNRAHIIDVLKGRRKKCGGFIWRYIDENEQHLFRTLTKPKKGRKYARKNY